MNGAPTPLASEPSPSRPSGREELPARVESVRRAALIRAFDAEAPRFLSVDVFDTLLLRPFERPTDLFAEVWKSLSDASDALASIDAIAFTRMRIEAEAAARASRKGGEITLDDIAAELSRSLSGRVAPDALAAAEIATERAFIELEPDTAALIAHAAARGVPYVLVSDMYLRGADLLSLLESAAAAAGVSLPSPSRVFVSGERRANKAGALFEIVLGELGCRPDELLHVGDNVVSDVEAPRRRGVRVVHVFRELPRLSGIFASEARHLPRGASGVTSAYDVGLRTTRVAAATSAMHTSTAALDHFQYGALVIGPLLTTFAEWVVDDCVRHGQHRVHCLMRDGHLIAPLVEKAAEAVSAKIDVRRLWASRYAIGAASFRDADIGELHEYLRKRRLPTLAVAARDLGLELDALRSACGIAHEAPLSRAEARRLVGAIVGSRAMRARIRDASDARRRRLFEYFRREGVLDAERVTIVDLGWGGSIQLRLARAFADLSQPRHIRGLYFATERRVLDLPLRSCSAESFLFHLGEPVETFRPLERTREIIELACMPKQGSLREIDDAGAVSTFEQGLPARQLDEIAELQRGVHHFADRWLAGSARRRAHLTHADRHAMLARLRAILARSVQEPTLEEVRLFESWEHDANDGAPDHEPLLGDEAVRARARYMSYWQIMDLSAIETFWPAGLARLVDRSAERASPLLRAALRFDGVRRGADLVSNAAATVARSLWK